MKAKESIQQTIRSSFRNEKRSKFVLMVTLIWITLFTLMGCKKENGELFSGNPAVYFRDFVNTDSVQYSFVGKVRTQDTVLLTIQLMGDALTKAKNYKVEVNKSLSTAIEGLHYKKMNDFETFSPGVFAVNFPLIVFNTDTSLLSKTYSIVLNLVPTDDLGIGYPNRKTLKVNITNQYVKPDYWDNLLNLYYGAYSRKKHQICVALQGGINFPATRTEALAKPPYGAAFWMSWGRVADQFFTDNIVYDENGNLIQPWPPF